MGGLKRGGISPSLHCLTKAPARANSRFKPSSFKTNLRRRTSTSSISMTDLAILHLLITWDGSVRHGDYSLKWIAAEKCVQEYSQSLTCLQIFLPASWRKSLWVATNSVRELPDLGGRGPVSLPFFATGSAPIRPEQCSRVESLLDALGCELPGPKCRVGHYQECHRNTRACSPKRNQPTL